MSHAARTHFGRADARLRRQLAGLLTPRRAMPAAWHACAPVREAQRILAADALRDRVSPRAAATDAGG